MGTREFPCPYVLWPGHRRSTSTLLLHPSLIDFSTGVYACVFGDQIRHMLSMSPQLWRHEHHMLHCFTFIWPLFHISLAFSYETTFKRGRQALLYFACMQALNYTGLARYAQRREN